MRQSDSSGRGRPRRLQTIPWTVTRPAERKRGSVNDSVSLSACPDSTLLETLGVVASMVALALSVAARRHGAFVAAGWH